MENEGAEGRGTMVNGLFPKMEGGTSRIKQGQIILESSVINERKGRRGKGC